MGRVQGISQDVKAFLSATATGILLFLFWDVLVEAIEPVENALNAQGLEPLLVARGAGLRGIRARPAQPRLLRHLDEGAPARRPSSARARPRRPSSSGSHFTGFTPARWLALFIATGIGLHNFSEGLAIGQSAAQDKISLAYVLVIGFGLHNATEGFGIVAPLSGDADKPSWRFLALLGVIGGAPTFFGTVVGQAWTSTAVSVLFLTLAAGSILYVVMELLNVCRLFSSKTITAWGLVLGLTLGFATDFVLVAAGV